MQPSYGTRGRHTNPCVNARQVLPLLTPAAATAAAQLLLKLYPLQQPLLSRHATDALGALVSGPGTASISAASIAALLDAVLAAQGQAGERQGADVSLAVVKLLEGGLPRWATHHLALASTPWTWSNPVKCVGLCRQDAAGVAEQIWSRFTTNRVADGPVKARACAQDIYA